MMLSCTEVGQCIPYSLHCVSMPLTVNVAMRYLYVLCEFFSGIPPSVRSISLLTHRFNINVCMCAASCPCLHKRPSASALKGDTRIYAVYKENDEAGNTNA